MPLIIAVLIIIVLFSTAKNQRTLSTKQQRENAAAIRKTNAQLEFDLAKKYVSLGNSIDDAIDLAKADVTAEGYVPCIPKNAFYTFRTSPGDLLIYGYLGADSYNSDAVRTLRDDFTMQMRRTRSPLKEDSDEFERQRNMYVYSNMPKTAFEYEVLRALYMRRLDAVPVGNYITYPGLGTCEVIGLDFNAMKHTVKSLDYGYIRKIAFGDKRIMKL